MTCGSRNNTVVTTSRRSRTVVDLLIAYSKRLDLVSALVSAVERLRAEDADEPETGRSVRSGQAPRVWRVSDRLSEPDLCSLVSGYRGGTTARELAQQFNISKSSVKRLLRDRGIRRTASVA
jgi:DNA-directed RNA polymerase specialized sigma24 family protein